MVQLVLQICGFQKEKPDSLANVLGTWYEETRPPVRMLVRIAVLAGHVKGWLQVLPRTVDIFPTQHLSVLVMRQR